MLRMFVFALCFSFLAQAEDYSYYGQDVSLIEWSKLDHKEWLDYQLWKDHRKIKDHYPKWRQNIRETRLQEIMGRVLDCVGECRVYRGEGYSKAMFRSSIKEGDEVVTQKDSYLWIFLYDGTMVRMGPESSISFRELNVALKKNFLHARINSGNILWLSRDSMELKKQSLRETDSLFLPLSYQQANSIGVELKENDLYRFVESVEIELEQQYSRLNNLIEKNNNVLNDKPTESFLVMQNGTVFGKNLRMEFVVLTGGKSFIKNRSFEYLNDEIEIIGGRSLFFYRGYANKNIFEVDDNIWYQISTDGRDISRLSENGTSFSMGEYLTKRIPTILVARELMLTRFSAFIFDEKISSKNLAVKHGFRLWSNQEMTGRVKFLKEYTRRIETTNLLVSKQLKNKMKKSGEILHGTNYSSENYRRALHNYFIKQEISDRARSEDEMLNSTNRKLWKRLNAIK